MLMAGLFDRLRRRGPTADSATRADEFMTAVAERDDVEIRVATTDTALMQELATRFDSTYGRSSPQCRAFVHSSLICVDCSALWEALSIRIGKPCPLCGGTRAILGYHLIDPEAIDEEDVAALRRLWREQAAHWWHDTGRSTAQCDRCHARVERPSGSLCAGDLLCDECTKTYLADGLATLRQDPYAFGPRELLLAREHRIGPLSGRLRLDSESLFDKYGFHDGDVPDDFEQWRARQGLEPVDWMLGGDWHGILDELVRTRLLPVLSRDVEVVTGTTDHNPVRALSVDEIPAEEFIERLRDGLEADLRPESVDVPYRDVEEVLQRTEYGLFPLAPTVTEVVAEFGLTHRQAVELRAITTSMSLTAGDIVASAQVLAGSRVVDPDEVRGEAEWEHQVAPTLAALRAAELAAHPDLVARTFDVAHWAAIHRHLFHDSDEAAGVVRPGVEVGQQLAQLGRIEPETAAVTLGMLVPDLVSARPFTSAVLHDAGIITSLRVLIQHALDGVGLTIDWKAFGSDVEHYLSVGELGELFDRAVG